MWICALTILRRPLVVHRHAALGAYVTLHLVKLCVGAKSIEDLEAWQTSRLSEMTSNGERNPRLFHTTFQTPKRQTELLDGGSLYWVIKGLILVRQRITGFGDGQKPDGSRCCLLYLDRTLVPVRPVPRRAFQGWRYFTADDVPEDFLQSGNDDLLTLPPEMRKDLLELCLI